jgi:8-oxo-dGTP pyrophosphatase MutT (NUDIX family)
MTEDIFQLGVKALIRDEAGKILLLQVNPSELKDDRRAYWDLPGGRVQVGASQEDTLKREVLEETGIKDLSGYKPMGMMLANIRIPQPDGSTVGLILSICSCSIPRGAKIALSNEHLSYGWFADDEASRLLSVKYPPEFTELLH